VYLTELQLLKTNQGDAHAETGEWHWLTLLHLRSAPDHKPRGRQSIANEQCHLDLREKYKNYHRRQRGPTQEDTCSGKHTGVAMGNQQERQNMNE
jgi:hypothetical protein